MLTWEFYREMGAQDSTGAVVHYFDESAQSLYLSNGIRTRAGEVPEGHWKTSPPGDEVTVGETAYNLLAADHPANGTLFLVAAEGDNLVFLRYLYAMDISYIYRAGTWREQVDNQIKQLSLDIKNISPLLFAAENTLFNPGAKITLAITAGDSDPYPLGTAYLDDVQYNLYIDTVPISGRNAIGYFLATQTFDDRNAYSGSRQAVIEAILFDAGVRSYRVQPDLQQVSLLFEPDATILEGLNDTLTDAGWRMVDSADGTVMVGDDAFLSVYAPNSRYIFNGDSEVFRRQTSKSADAAYTRVAVRDSEGFCVYRDVAHWHNWQLGLRKTKYYDAPEGYFPSQMDAMAESLANELQYVGIGEVFTSPLRPQLLCGDIAEIYVAGDIESTSLGSITEITHTFGESGFFTDFSIDSGGAATDAGEYSIVSRSAVLNGYNRKQRVLDFMGIVSEKKASQVYAGGGRIIIYSIPAEAISIAPSSTMRIF